MFFFFFWVGVGGGGGGGGEGEVRSVFESILFEKAHPK